MSLRLAFALSVILLILPCFPCSPFVCATAFRSGRTVRRCNVVRVTVALRIARSSL